MTTSLQQTKAKTKGCRISGSLDLLYGFEFIFDDIRKIGYHAVGAPVAELFGGLELIDSPDSDSLAGVMRLFNELL